MGREEKKRGDEEWESIYRILNNKNTNYEKNFLLGILNVGNFTTNIYTLRMQRQTQIIVSHKTTILFYSYEFKSNSLLIKVNLKCLSPF